MPETLWKQRSEPQTNRTLRSEADSHFLPQVARWEGGGRTSTWAPQRRNRSGGDDESHL